MGRVERGGERGREKVNCKSSNSCLNTMLNQTIKFQRCGNDKLILLISNPADVNQIIFYPRVDSKLYTIYADNVQQ